MTRRTLFLLASLAAAACANDSNGEAVGNLAVRVTTTGTADPDGYVLSLEGQADRPLASTDTTYFFDLPIGDYSATLSDEEVGCTIQNGATKVKYVAIGSNELVFSVTCP